jgi:signal transduction histidine kinase
MDSQDRIKILIVDDSKDTLLAMQAVLSELGHGIVCAHSGEEALKRLLEDDFALILLDVIMPGMGGLECARFIRQREKSKYTPIIFLTASDKGDTQMFKGYASGAVDYLFKPVNPEILKSKVEVFFNLFRKNEEVKRNLEQMRIMEQISYEMKLADAKQKLELSQQRDSFIATLTHDLKTPLICAVSGLNMILDNGYGEVKDEQKYILSLIKQGIDDQLQMIQNLLEIYRDASERLHFQVVDLKELLLRCTDELKPITQAHDLKIRINLAAKLKEVWVDKMAIHRVLMNLLGNAIKFTPDQGEIIMIADNALDNGKEFVRLSIKDTGKGISLEEQKNLFQQYYQGDEGKKKSTGTGLGLYLCRKIIESHNGQISLTSSLGQGTTFSISLPVFSASEETSESQTGEHASQTSQGESPSVSGAPVGQSP